MPVLVRNTEPGRTVLSSDPKGSEFVEWAGKDDPMGGDVQPVPDTIANSVPFYRAVQRGILVIENEEDNPELVERINRQNASWQARRREAEQASTEAITPETNNDLITVPCVGPNPRGAGACNADVTTREKAKDEKPPLCATHAGLAPEFVSEETGQMVNGKSEKKWVRVSLGARQRQES